eukprot:superscaffoldBa00000998_g8438
MPTNQSSPWGGGKLRVCSNADSPTTTTSVSTHAKTVAATKVPFSQPSLELSRRKDQAKPLSSNVASSASAVRQTAVAPSVVSLQENGDRSKTNTQSQFTTVPDGSPALPQQIDRIQGSHQLLSTGRKQACSSLIETSAPSSIPKKECQVGLNVQLTSTTEKCMSLQTSQPGNTLAMSRCQAATGDAPLGLESLSSVCHQDLFIKGQPALQQTNKLMLEATDCSSSPSLPPLCLTLCEHQGTALGKDASSLNTAKVEIKSTTRETTTTTRKSHSDKPATKSIQAQNSCTKITALNSPLLVRGSPSSVVAATSHSKPQTTASLDTNKQAQESQCSPGSTLSTCRRISPPAANPFPNGPTPTVLSASVSATQVEQPTTLDAIPDDSDCSSINGTSSTASLTLLAGIEEPMSLEVEDEREERPALVPSLFPFFPPTLYFSTANEKESHDWLGCWGHHMKSPGFKALGEHQKLNHFPGTFQIGRKDRLWRNLSKMQVRFGKQEFSFFPRTFILPQDIKLLRKAWEDSGSRQKWIIKPPASARGIGIQVIHKWSQMPRKRPLLVQKYLHKPYLISGNKFDLRIYVYVTSYDPLRIYIFSDGLVRFASCKYSSSMKTLGNKFMHLTNYSVNKKNSEYQTNSDDKACQGHKWALKALWQYLGSKGVNTTLIWEKIKDIVIKTIIALHSNTALDVSIKGQMIRDLLNLAGFHIPQREDVVVPCSSTSSSTSSLYGGNRERTKPDLSADEKVKRAFYLTQRYADQDFLSTVLDVLTPEDVHMLAESEDELSRRGQFERIFPSPASSRYLRFFECSRYLNILLDQWEQKYWNNRTKGISLLRTLCQKGVHLGTNDPAHMWSKCSYTSKCEPHRRELVSPSRPRVVVSHQHQSDRADEDDGSDGDVASVSSLPVSPSPGSSVTSR